MSHYSFTITISAFFTGLYIVFVLGISEEPLDVILQLGGIFISVISLTKGVAEYQVTKGFENEVSFLETLKCMAFVFPQTLVRVVGITLVFAFLKFYAAIPVALIMITNTINALIAVMCYSYDDSHFLFATVLASFFAPLALTPGSRSHRLYLRLSVLTTNLILIACLVFIFHLPDIIPPEILIQTEGFQHLNLNISGTHFQGNIYLFQRHRYYLPRSPQLIRCFGLLTSHQ